MSERPSHMSTTRRINVLSTKVIKEGQGAKGPWKLRSVEATDEDGNPIGQELKTFSDLKGTVDVEVERQADERYGISFLLKPVRRGGGNGGNGEAAALRVRVERLESEVRRLSGIVDVREPREPSEPPDPAAAPDF